MTADRSSSDRPVPGAEGSRQGRWGWLGLWSDPQGDVPDTELIRMQRDVLRRDALVRLLASALGYVVALPFVPLPLIVSCMVVHLTAEILSDRALDGLTPEKGWPGLGLAMMSVFVVEVAFMLPAAVIWHDPSPYAKALAVGIAASTLMHLSTLRAIILPLGMAGIAAVSLTALVSIGLYWLKTGAGLVSLPMAFSVLCILGTGGYSLMVLRSNHHLHLTSARERARAEAANAAKTRFLAQMSHELRTPLNAILGLGRAELARSDDPVGRERLSVLITSAEGLSMMLDDVLDIAAADEGELPLHPVPVDPHQVLAAAVDLFRPSVEAAGLRLTLRVDPSVPRRALLDGQRLRQCLVNLLSNAAKQTVSGGIDVAAALRPAPEEGGVPLLQVDLIDTGPGIPPDLRAHLFERYVTQGGEGGGRGLGLAISRALARRMGGDLVLAPLTDAPGTGAHFVLTVALSEAPAPVVVSGAVSGGGALAEGGLGGARVLVVDDLASNLMVARHLLEGLGCAVDEARSGEAALAALRGGAVVPDAVLLDLNMPGMDGPATLDRIRSRPGAARLPVIALTADGGAELRARLIARGFDGLVAKPVEAAALAAELGRALGVARGAPGR